MGFGVCAGILIVLAIVSFPLLSGSMPGSHVRQCFVGTMGLPEQTHLLFANDLTPGDVVSQMFKIFASRHLDVFTIEVLRQVVNVRETRIGHDCKHLLKILLHDNLQMLEIILVKLNLVFAISFLDKLHQRFGCFQRQCDGCSLWKKVWQF